MFLFSKTSPCATLNCNSGIQTRPGRRRSLDKLPKYSHRDSGHRTRNENPTREREREYFLIFIQYSLRRIVRSFAISEFTTIVLSKLFECTHSGELSTDYNLQSEALKATSCCVHWHINTLDDHLSCHIHIPSCANEYLPRLNQANFGIHL